MAGLVISKQSIVIFRSFGYQEYYPTKPMSAEWVDSNINAVAEYVCMYCLIIGLWKHCKKVA